MVKAWCWVLGESSLSLLAGWHGRLGAVYHLWRQRMKETRLNYWSRSS